MLTNELTDAEIVEQSLNNKELFAVIIERYAERLARYARRLGVRRTEDVEDLLQEVFLKTYQNLNAFDSTFSFSAWIYRIMHNETISFFRKRSIRPEGNMEEDSESILALISDEEDVLEQLEKQSDGEHVHRALDQIDFKYKEILVLRFFEQREYAEISDILEIPIGSVATLIHRAKKVLRKELGYLAK